jgi:hypothetical protein
LAISALPTSGVGDTRIPTATPAMSDFEVLVRLPLSTRVSVGFGIVGVTLSSWMRTGLSLIVIAARFVPGPLFLSVSLFWDGLVRCVADSDWEAACTPAAVGVAANRRLEARTTRARPRRIVTLRRP